MIKKTTSTLGKKKVIVDNPKRDSLNSRQNEKKTLSLFFSGAVQ